MNDIKGNFLAWLVQSSANEVRCDMGDLKTHLQHIVDELRSGKQLPHSHRNTLSASILQCRQRNPAQYYALSELSWLGAQAIKGNIQESIHAAVRLAARPTWCQTSSERCRARQAQIDKKLQELGIA